MARRMLFLSLCFLSASAFIAKMSKTEPVFIREPLAQLPLKIGAWQGRDFDIEERIVAVLGVQDYLNRSYYSSNAVVSLYVGFYQTQRQGSTMHSPMNCLPGAGWDPVDRSQLSIPVTAEPPAPTRMININRIVIQKGMDRQIALYWYQAHGRVVASEYWGKIYTVLDAMRMNRTDGSLVRVITQIVGSGPEGEQTAQTLAVEFVQSIFPLLSRHLPD
ncbi:MAG: EpsI family protein [Acidobacteria bacterium]|nr:MAG: EpsI family protein [Acidobacteriota bacterium]